MSDKLLSDYKSGAISYDDLWSMIEDDDEQNEILKDVLPRIVEYDISIGKDITLLLKVADELEINEPYLVTACTKDKNLILNTMELYRVSRTDSLYDGRLNIGDIPIMFLEKASECDNLDFVASVISELMPDGVLGYYAEMYDEFSWRIAAALMRVSNYQTEVDTAREWNDDEVGRGEKRLYSLYYGDV